MPMLTPEELLRSLAPVDEHDAFVLLTHEVDRVLGERGRGDENAFRSGNTACEGSNLFAADRVAGLVAFCLEEDVVDPKHVPLDRAVDAPSLLPP
jgi:hypothetical protein